MLTYEQWCENNTDIKPLIRSLKSSLPEQYIGFYLNAIFGDEIEYQKQFKWLGRSSLDIYIPSLSLAIEYDGGYYHSNKKVFDSYKTSICRSHKIYIIRILEQVSTEPQSRKRNEISYYYEKKYKNIDVAIIALIKKINKKYDLSIEVDIDIERDEQEILSYIQNKYHKESIAVVWPESIDYWLEEENGFSIHDILHTDNRYFMLKCPHCGKKYMLYTKYFHNRKSLVPCDCEYEEIERSFHEAIRNFKEKGEVIDLDDSLESRRLYDRMKMIVDKMWRCSSKEEAELYKRLGFTSPYIDVYLSQF